MSSDSGISLPAPRPDVTRIFWIACAVGYVLLSCVDLLVTWLLVDGVGGAYEANPLAADILLQHGWAGLAVFKGGCVAVVLGAGAWLWRRRPRAARLLISAASLSSLAVVGYSLWLTDFGSEAANWSRQLAHAQSRAERLIDMHEAQDAYRQRLEELTLDVTYGRCTLRDAAAALAAYLEGIRHNPLPYLERHYQGLPKEATLAAHLVRHVGFRVGENPEQARQQLGNLARQFAAYRAPLPHASRESFGPSAAKTRPSRRGAAN